MLMILNYDVNAECNFFNIISFIITIELLYYFYTVIKHNLLEGRCLRPYKDKFLIARMTIFTAFMTLNSINCKICIVIFIFIYLLLLVRHLECIILRKYRNNIMFDFYLYEIKKLKKDTYISALVCFIFLILAILCK